MSEELPPRGFATVGEDKVSLEISEPAENTIVPPPAVVVGPSGPVPPPPSHFPLNKPVSTSVEVQTEAMPQTLDKLSYKTVDEIIRSVYNYQESNASTALDFLATYLRGQKILYMESKTLCEQKLNTLMLPAIFISGLCTLLSLVLGEVKAGPPLVSGLNALNGFILAIISYLKLDGKAEAHKTAAYKFDKLQSYAEFNSGKILFKAGEVAKFNDIITNIESGVSEVKETNQFIIPEKIRHRFPDLYNINVFAEVKKLQNQEMIKINDLKKIINQNISLMNKTIRSATEEAAMLKNEADQNKLLDEIIRFRDQYLKIDEKFRAEIDRERLAAKRRCDPCNWFKS